MRWLGMKIFTRCRYMRLVRYSIVICAKLPPLPADATKAGSELSCTACWHCRSICSWQSASWPWGWARSPRRVCWSLWAARSTSGPSGRWRWPFCCTCRSPPGSPPSPCVSRRKVWSFSNLNIWAGNYRICMIVSCDVSSCNNNDLLLLPVKLWFKLYIFRLWWSNKGYLHNFLEE